MLLKKGLEIEMFAGKKDGNVLPLSGELLSVFPDLSQEPDQRNFEYITSPTTSYESLFQELIIPRIKIRNYLSSKDLTLIPGSTMPLAFEKVVYPSKPDDDYHRFILTTYKTDIVTTSIHINIGVDNNENFFKLLSAIRLDTPLFLALSASSCFHDGKVTGYKSFRWHSFPKTPTFIPFFTSHNEYIEWFNNQVKTKTMFNERHLWSSIRPNGPHRPNELNRIEIRICDFTSDIKKVISIVALIECLIQSYIRSGNWPKILSKSKNELDSLENLLNEQEKIVAKDGLDAKIWNWRNSTEQKCSEVIESLYSSLSPLANELGIIEYLTPILDTLENGNESTNFIKKYKKVGRIEETIQYFIEEFTNTDLKYKTLFENQVKSKANI
jgi:predicted glutamate--cysteine ligase